MSGPEGKKPDPGSESNPAPAGGSKTAQKKPLRGAKDQESDSDDIERAVYDGMQDLRAGKTK